MKNSSQPAILGVSFFKGTVCTVCLYFNTEFPTLFYFNPPCLYAGVPDSPYWVLSTDYQSYSLVYSCFNYFGLFHIDFAWILARTRVLPEDVITLLHDKLTSAGVNINRLTVSNQTGCDVMMNE